MWQFGSSLQRNEVGDRPGQGARRPTGVESRGRGGSGQIGLMSAGCGYIISGVSHYAGRLLVRLLTRLSVLDREMYGDFDRYRRVGHWQKNAAGQSDLGWASHQTLSIQGHTL